MWDPGHTTVNPYLWFVTRSMSGRREVVHGLTHVPSVEGGTLGLESKGPHYFYPDTN